MHLQDTNTLLNLQGVIINKIPEIVDNTWVVPVEPPRLYAALPLLPFKSCDSQRQ